MNYEKLKDHHPQLLEFLEQAGYSPTYRRQLKRLIEYILEHGQDRNWTSYEDVYDAYEATGVKPRSLAQLRMHLRTMSRFENDGSLPTRTKRSYLLESKNFRLLSEEFQELLRQHEQLALSEGLKQTTIRNQTSNAMEFLTGMRIKGFVSLEEIDEKSVLSYFTDFATGERTRVYTGDISAVFRHGLKGKEAECKRILAWIPGGRRPRKNIEYLTRAELIKIEEAVNNKNNSLTLRDRAIGTLLLRTPLRRSDIAAIRLTDIDWNEDRIYIIQPKTQQPLDIPLTASLGNALWQYITQERPSDSEDNHVFLSTTSPVHGLTGATVADTADRIYDAAEVRMTHGQRRGTHLFRFRAVAEMLAEGVDRAIISKTLGHESPNSIQPYLSADFPQLKKCALSIELFPVDERLPL